MTDSPHEYAERRDDFYLRRSRPEIGMVDAAPDNVDTERFAHVVRVTGETFESAEPAAVTVDAYGDANVPPVGSRVLIERTLGGTPVVTDVLYAPPPEGATELDGLRVPDYETGTRRIGHHASNAFVEFEPDGTLVVMSEREDQQAVFGRVTLNTDGTTVVESRGNLGATKVQTAPNGSVTIDKPSGQSVVVDGGSTPVVTDVGVSTTTDADGHVTDVSLDVTTTDDILVP
jgi:hypothetical protein